MAYFEGDTVLKAQKSDIDSLHNKSKSTGYAKMSKMFLDFQLLSLLRYFLFAHFLSKEKCYCM